MKSVAKRNIIPLLISMLAFLAVLCSVSTTAKADNRETDVSVASAGNVLALVPGTFSGPDVVAILKQINDYRLEACQNGYPNPNNPAVKLTASDYVALQWSGDLEWIAQTRAAEGTVYQSHTRPNGNICFTAKHNGVESWAENIAWNTGSIPAGISQWYNEKTAWVNQTPGASTGYYTQMINPNTKYIGVSCFVPQSGALSCIICEFSSAANLSTAQQGLYGKYFQIMEVPVSSVAVRGKNSVEIGKTASYTALTLTMTGSTGNKIQTPALHYGSCTYSSSNTKVATIDANGLLKALEYGSTNVTITYQGSKFTKTVAVVGPVKGTTFTSGGMDYKVTNSSGEVSLTRGIVTALTVVIPDTVVYKDITHRVTSIGNNAFRNRAGFTTLILGNNVTKVGQTAFAGCRHLKSVWITPNVTTIYKKAFYNCKNLRTLFIKSAKLKGSRVGSSAFGRTKIKYVRVVPGKKNAYKKWLYKKGVPKSAKIR